MEKQKAEKRLLSLSALLLSACFALVVTPAYARSSTQLSTKHILPAMSPAPQYTSDVLGARDDDGDGDWQVIRLADWRLPAPMEEPTEEPAEPTEEPDGQKEPTEAAEEQPSDETAPEGAESPEETGELLNEEGLEQLAGEPEQGLDKSPASEDGETGEREDEEPGEERSGTQEISPNSQENTPENLENTESIIYNNKLRYTREEAKSALFHVSDRAGTHPTPEDFALAEGSYLRSELSLDGDKAELLISLKDEAYALRGEPTTDAVKVAWQGLYAEYWITLLPFDYEEAEPTDGVPAVLDIPLGELPDSFALFPRQGEKTAEAYTITLQVSETLPEDQETEAPPRFLDLDAVSYQPGQTGRRVTQEGSAAFTVPTAESGLLLLTLDTAKLRELSPRGSLRVTAQGADTLGWATLPDTGLPPVELSDRENENIAVLPVTTQWGDLKFDYTLQRLDASEGWLDVPSWAWHNLSATEQSGKLSLWLNSGADAAARLSAGSYRLLLRWSWDGRIAYESRVSLFISYSYFE